MDEALVAALQRDYRTAPITPPERVMCDYVVKLTKDATQCSPTDHESLRAAGFDAFLIGEQLMLAPDPGMALAQLLHPVGQE